MNQPADNPSEVGPRDPYLRVLTVCAVIGVAIGLPFALKAGAEFFLPLTAALILAIALVPVLSWLERRGLPSGLSAAICVIGLISFINAALALIVLPASGWFVGLPERLPRIRANLAPLIDFYENLQRFVERSLQTFATETAAQAQAVAVETPSSFLGYLTESAPAAAVQTLFGLLLIFFFLAGWTRLRRRTIESRGSFGSALTTARVIQNVVDATTAYISTITIINLALGLAVALALWMIGMPSPFMWGGIVALCNFVPYVGPVIAALLLALGGLMTFDSIALALLPALVQISFHTVEANLVTPMILGRRLTLNPMLILISLSFWGWIWGAPGAFLAVPILLVIQTIWSTLSERDGAPAAPTETATGANADDAGKKASMPHLGG